MSCREIGRSAVIDGFDTRSFAGDGEKGEILEGDSDCATRRGEQRRASSVRLIRTGSSI